MLSLVFQEVLPPLSATQPVTGAAPASSSPPTDPAPRFPTYLLPSFTRPFRRRRQSSFLSNATADNDVPSLSNSPTESPISSPTEDLPGAGFPLPRASSRNANTLRLTRVHPETIRCSTCGTDFAFTSQIVSKGFTGRHGRAYLVSPPEDGDGRLEANLINVKIGKSEQRILVTGSHVVADIHCNTCRAKVGWKYVDAKEEAQKYKIGKFILETQRTINYKSWEDATLNEVSGHETRPMNAPEEDDREPILFDSEDEDECEELFAGIWDPDIAAKRRRNKVNQR
ncbi:yippee zinc-binding/DNA-binding /Mis18, centromere assembly-domain-containing protein [Xylariaceae sp. FL0255]|nr:yippee zinc-binding/DNA-binding /Mis18, centromere assembly-domain-containing protein [Xylariaceae sp. FL0255]